VGLLGARRSKLSVLRLSGGELVGWGELDLAGAEVEWAWSALDCDLVIWDIMVPRSGKETISSTLLLLPCSASLEHGLEVPGDSVSGSLRLLRSLGRLLESNPLVGV